MKKQIFAVAVGVVAGARGGLLGGCSDASRGVSRVGTAKHHGPSSSRRACSCIHRDGDVPPQHSDDHWNILQYTFYQCNQQRVQPNRD